MGIIDRWLEDPADRRWRYRQDYRDHAADRREARRNEQRVLDREQRAQAQAVAQRQRENAALIRGYQDQEKSWYGSPRTVYVGGNNGSGKPWKVTHFAAQLPLCYVTHPDAPDQPVVFAPHFQRSRNGDLMRDETWREKARETLAVWETVEDKYKGILARLRDDDWWRELCIAAGLTSSVTSDETWSGQYATGTRKLVTVTVPTVERVYVAEDGLRIVISLDVKAPPKKWQAAVDVLRSAFKASGMNAADLRVGETASGAPLLAFNDLDPFEHLDQLESTFDLDKGRSLLGITSAGKEAWVVWSGSSGMVVGGVPGSGKTASMMPVFASLAGHAELHVFDGKASYDLDPLKHISRTYDRTASVDAPLATLQSVFGLIEKRATALMRNFGHANFWNVNAEDREKLDLYPIVIVLDEAQTWTNPEGMDSDDKKVVAAVTRYMRELVLKGRSSGIFTVITTQQPDVKTIPSNLRNNAGRKLAFRVSTAEQGVTILGNLPPGAPSPTDIPMSARGRFVMEADGQGVVMGQAGYQSPEELEARLSGCSPVPDQADVVARLLGERSGDTPSAPSTSPDAAQGAAPSRDSTGQEPKRLTPEQVRQEAIRRGYIPADEPDEPAGDEPETEPETETPANTKTINGLDF